MSDELKTKVQELIDTMINPAVAGHGGYVELIDVQDNRVYLQMGGGCQGCGAADVTLKAGIERLIKDELPEVLEVLDTTDHAAGVAAAIGAHLGLRSNPVAAAAAARNKHEMRQRLHAAGVPAPRFRRMALSEDPARAAREVDYPCVLKPLALSASRGVIRADDPDAFVAAVRRITAILGRDDVGVNGDLAAALLVEEFVPGREVALEGLLTAGGLQTLALFDKPDPLDGPFFEETIYVTPSRLPAEAQARIAEVTLRACAALGLTEGPIHAELRVNDAGPWVIEVAARST